MEDSEVLKYIKNTELYILSINPQLFAVICGKQGNGMVKYLKKNVLRYQNFLF